TSLTEQERLSNYLTNILESLSSGVLVVDTDGNITLFNRGAELITGIKAEKTLGKHYNEIMGSETPEDLTPLSTLKNGDRRSNMEKPIRSRSGRAISVGFSTSPLINRAGDMIGAVEIFMDLSQIKSLEEELSRMDKLAALGQMAATMAHKIRNPLGGIAGFAGLLQLELEGNENGKRIIGKISEGVDKLNSIVTSLLSYTAQLKLKTHHVDLAERMEHIALAIREERPDETENIRFAVETPGGSVSAEIDVEHFYGAMLNVLRNSVEAIDCGGDVVIRVFHGEYDLDPDDKLTGDLKGIMVKTSSLLESRLPCAVVTVTDSGGGMDDEVRGKLFMPFYTTKENGNGLGLALTRKVIEAHHGEVIVTSAEGTGTAVGVILPRTSVV
ncbi:nitrogen regulation protein NR(II), partial [Candidatus Latescibacterota bacterium]